MHSYRTLYVSNRDGRTENTGNRLDLFTPRGYGSHVNETLKITSCLSTGGPTKWTQNIFAVFFRFQILWNGSRDMWLSLRMRAFHGIFGRHVAPSRPKSYCTGPCKMSYFWYSTERSVAKEQSVQQGKSFIRCYLMRAHKETSIVNLRMDDMSVPDMEKNCISTWSWSQKYRLLPSIYRLQTL